MHVILCIQENVHRPGTLPDPRLWLFGEMHHDSSSHQNPSLVLCYGGKTETNRWTFQQTLTTKSPGYLWLWLPFVNSLLVKESVQGTLHCGPGLRPLSLSGTSVLHFAAPHLAESSTSLSTGPFPATFCRLWYHPVENTLKNNPPLDVTVPYRHQLFSFSAKTQKCCLQNFSVLQTSPKHQDTKASILPRPVNHFLEKNTLSFMKYSPLRPCTCWCFSPALLVLACSPLTTCCTQNLLVGVAQGSVQTPFSSYTVPCAEVIPPSLLTLNKSADGSYISPESFTTALLPCPLACLGDNLRSTKQNSWFSTSSPNTHPTKSLSKLFCLGKSFSIFPVSQAWNLNHPWHLSFPNSHNSMSHPIDSVSKIYLKSLKLFISYRL